MQAIFQIDQNPNTSRDYVRQFISEGLRFPELETFAMRLVDGVFEHQRQIDDWLARSAENWTVDRMAAVDRAILRLGVYEMALAENKTPPRVVISESVEIAKRFSTTDSARFVNGVLDRAAKLIAPAAQAEPGDGPASDPPDGDLSADD